MESTAHVLLLVTLFYLSIITHAQDDTTSVCHSRQYRLLTLHQQNEHQCMILERLHQDLTTEQRLIKSQYHDLYTLVSKFQTNMHRNIASLTAPSRDSSKTMPNLIGIPLVRDCSELQMHGVNLSGVYPIRLPNRKIVNVWCDMETDFGGWTVVQRRIDGKLNFTRDWGDYSSGFGNVNSEYWLGNDNLYWLTQNKNYSVQFDLWDWEDNYAYALYDYFKVENDQKNYQLKINGYSGTAGDAMYPYHDGMRFSTVDRDNDQWHSSCAKKDQSGWWFKACGYASLNGVYIQNGTTEIAPDGVVKGIIWTKWKKEYGYSLKRTEIKIKPLTLIKYHRKQHGNDVIDNSVTDDSVIDSTIKTTTTKLPISPPQLKTETTTTTTTTTKEPDYYDYDYNTYDDL